MPKNHEFYQISLKLILKNQKGEILGMGGLPTGSFANFYDFPGGRINKNEFKTPLWEILKREVAEEIGPIRYTLNPTPVAVGKHLLLAKISRLKKDIPVLYLFFAGKYLGGKINPSAEHLNYKWLKLTKANVVRYFNSGNLEGIKMYLT